MNYLITGGTGLIGRKLMAKLISDENNLWLLTRNIANAKKLFTATNINFLDNLNAVDFAKLDIIINLAGEAIADKRWSNQQKQRICQSRWQITEQLTKNIQNARSRPKLFISGSAIGIYGRQDNAPIDESFTRFHSEFSHLVCERWEQLALQAQSAQTRVVLLRTGIVLSTDGGALTKMLLPFKLGFGGKIGNGQQMMSWIHIDDMIAAILFIIQQSNIDGPVNLVSENPVTNQEFSQTLATTLHRPAFCTMPSLVIKLLFGELSELVLYGQNVKPAQLVSNNFQFEYPELSIALSSLLMK